MRLFLLSLACATRVTAPALCGGALLLAFATSCTVFESTCEPDDRECLSNPLFAKGVGGDCTRAADCRAGLSCIDETCQPTGDTERGEKCRLTAECGDSDYCGSQRVCTVAGTVKDGQGCMTTGSCEHGLVCEPPNLSEMGSVSLADLAQVSGLCRDGGKKEQGGKCASVTDCLAGLSCVDEQLVCNATMACGDKEIEPGSMICASLPASDVEIPALPQLWEGIQCPKVDAEDPKVSYFEVPRPGDDDPTGFYALPFPTDIRRSGGRVDMSTHPSAPESLGLPLVSRYIEVAGEDIDGFSTNPVVYFRFSHPYKFESVTAEALSLIDITDKGNEDEYGKELGIEWHNTSGDLSNYICPHWLAIKTPAGSPLKPNHTYAAIVTTGVTQRDDKPFERGSDLDAMLAASAPSDSDLDAAYEAFAPLREWIDETGQNADRILNATVFTTHNPELTIERLRERVQADTLPALGDDLVVCGAGVTSPCETEETIEEDGEEVTVTRGACPPTVDPDYAVIHGHIRLPVFQKGTAPYLAPEDGGEIEVDSGGNPLIQTHQNVCFAMSVPTAAAPAGGYPVLVYGHGTGGSFTGEMDSAGYAKPLANGTVPAVLVAIDLPEHGSRRGDTDKQPEELFYNFLNPRAARDNVLQGSADLMAVIRWVKESGGLAAGEPLDDAVAFDNTRIALMGHSQGSTHSALIASYEPDIIGVVLSGNGGNLAISLLHKTSPVNIAKVIPLGLMDPDSEFELAGGDFNPALAIIQWVFDSSDPTNFAGRLARTPTTQVPDGHHVFMTYGVGDTFAPEQTQKAYVRAAGRNMPVVSPVLVDLKLPKETVSWPSEPAPLQGNAMVGSAVRTIGVRQYEPSDPMLDGHFVATRSGEQGRRDVERFLDELLAGSTPSIGE